MRKIIYNVQGLGRKVNKQPSLLPRTSKRDLLTSFFFNRDVRCVVNEIYLFIYLFTGILKIYQTAPSLHIHLPPCGHTQQSARICIIRL